MTREQGDVLVEADGSLRVADGEQKERLRARAGAYSLLPSPPDLLILRKTSGIAPGARPALAGEIAERGTILEILQFITTAGWTGELLVAEGETRRTILFDGPSIILATSSVAAERLGEVLYRHGVLSREQFDEALRLMSPTRRLGDIVVQKGWLKPNDLYAMLQKQVEEIFFSTLSMSQGLFVFSRGIDAASIPVRVNLSVGALLMEGVQRIDEWAYFREKIPDGNVVPVKVTGKDAGGDKSAEKIFALIDGKKSLDELSRASGLGEFEGTKALFALLQRGAVQLKKASASNDPSSLSSQVEGFNEVLRDVHKTVDGAGVGAEARETLAMFLQGGGAFDVLFDRAGPLPDGAFDTEILVGNLQRIRTDDPQRVVQQALHDYVSFALFAAGSVLRREDHQLLARRVQERLTELRVG